eukprot:CAMPEP_0178390626 /NCGR_PEP_ID=MMETSP0689_2-20121128/10743_1 /TAXON_ID=160604 /ORGANISM="Amphidinium massartii, Strain CS-259" /LENGTH=577 /DNA_ID=CAMNT_0020011141 /DNA_START=71 /DNA_END=1804 /DNA_ORIENTATION=+
MVGCSFTTIIVSAILVPAMAKGGFLSDRAEIVHDRAAFDEDVAVAVAEGLQGFGSAAAAAERFAAIEQAILPMWDTLPKVGSGDRIEVLSLRRLAHRYFSRHYSILIRGFEPTRVVNRSHWGVADILSERVPSYVEAVLHSQHEQQIGFTFRDATTLIAILENLVSDSDAAMLERVYEQQLKRLDGSLSQFSLYQVLEDYVVHWMVADDPDSLYHLLANRSLVEVSFPHWSEVVDFIRGQVRSFSYARQRHAAAASPLLALERSKAGDVLSQRYSLSDAKTVVSGITRSFASFWESECTEMKMQLVEMDYDATGRVPLSAFYKAAMGSEWRFGESEAYLRELGAIDDTSRSGPKVIIPNYMQGASNCIIPTSHYLVCCASECESILGDLERAVRAPVATVEEILGVIGNMTRHTTLEEDEPVRLQGTLSTQLRKVADAHGGKVPLQGRLFAQWLHYVFPRECPFPHKAGLATAQTPSQFGEQYLATSDEMRAHAAQASTTGLLSSVSNDTEWMGQWSHEEELVGEYIDLRAPWEDCHRYLLYTLCLFAIGLTAGVVKINRGKKSGAILPGAGKVHSV